MQQKQQYQPWYGVDADSKNKLIGHVSKNLHNQFAHIFR